MVFLGRHAGKFVILAWLLFLLTIGACFTIGVAAAIGDFYHPLNRNVPYAVTWLNILQVAFCASLAVALCATAALYFKQRLAAALSVVGVWCVLITGSFAAMQMTEPGPDFFVRYVGDQRHVVPLSYHPTASRDGPPSLHISLCIDSLRGRYGEKGWEPCLRNAFHLETSVKVRPGSDRLCDSVIQCHWDRRPIEMEPGKTSEGYEAYNVVGTVNAREDTRYFVRRDNEGNVIRFATCTRSMACIRGCFGAYRCEHRTLAGGYDITYSTVDFASSGWDWKDDDLARLIASWRKPD